ncbi:MAG: LPS-assembly protein LptD, partial [Alphaproteobacteria bacterium]|nr:LPS-assembly protein LptD [Alphaproteobacteria bacterium]
MGKLRTCRRQRGRRVAKAAAVAVAFLGFGGPVSAASRTSPTPHGFADTASLLGKPGGTGLIRADEVTYDTGTKIVTAQGHVEIDYNDRILLADTVTYDQVHDTATADGHVSILEPNGMVAFASHAVLRDKMRDGVADGFSALIGQKGRFAAVKVTRTKNGTILTGIRGVYSSCKVCDQPGKRTPLWQVRARKVVYNQPEHEIVYRDATFEMFGVPIGYTPYFSHPDPTVKRRSGLLPPELGSSSILGSFARLPAYIALNDSQDATIAPTFTTHAGVLLETEYRQRWNSGGMWLQASGAYNPNGGPNEDEHQWYGSLFGSGRIPLWDNLWHLGFDAQFTSNQTFLKRYNLSILDRLVNDLFVEGLSGRSRFDLGGYYFQGLRLTDAQELFPLVLPALSYTYIPEHDVLGGEVRLDINGAAVSRDSGPNSQRLSAEARWRLPLVTGNGQLITFQADVRGDVFRVTNNDLADFPDIPEKADYVWRGLPYLALDWRWPFVSSAFMGGTSLVVQPIVQAIAAPYGGNPSGIPNEDSRDFELDDTNLFSLEHLPGYDVAETGPRANAGFEGTAFFPSGGSVDLLVGQTYRLKPDPNLATFIGFENQHDTSDVIERFTIKFPAHFSLTHRADIDQETGNLRRNEVYVDGTWGRSVLELSYLKIEEPDPTIDLPSRQEVNGQATIGILDYWVLFAGARRDIENDRM